MMLGGAARGARSSTDARRRVTTGFQRGRVGVRSAMKVGKRSGVMRIQTLRAPIRKVALYTKNMGKCKPPATPNPGSPVLTTLKQNAAAEKTGEYRVFAIVDRKKSDRGVLYRVQWCDREDGFRWDDTWEAGWSLREDGFMEACTVVDAWKASSNANFYKFCRNNGHVHYIGASPQGMCAFYAIGLAADLLGNTGWHTSDVVSKFKEHCAARGRPISPRGITYGELRFYVKFANDKVPVQCKQISTRTLDANLLGGVSGSSTVQKLIDLALHDRIYLCAGYSSLRVSHCLVIRVSEGEKFVSDETTFNQGIQQCDLEWLYGISFLRKVELYSADSA